MRKRLKGLLVLWLAFLMAVSTPMTAYAATVNDVYYYTGTEALVSNNCYRDKIDALGESGFKVDTSLKTQFSNRIPDGYSVTGWNLWKATSGFYVSDAYALQSDGLISKENFDARFTPSSDYYEDISYAIVEPILKLDYEITHQPTNAEPRVGLNEAGEAAVGTSYQWYSVQENPADAEVVTETNQDGLVVYGTYDKSTGIGVGNEYGCLQLNLSKMTVGDILRITYSKTESPELSCDYISEESTNTDGENTVLLCKVNLVKDDGSIDFSYYGSSSCSVKVEVIHEEAITSVTGPFFSGENGDYYCKVIFENGGLLISERFTYTRSTITPNLTSNGSYKLQVDGKDITEKVSEEGEDLLAIPGKTVTVVPEPANGYELERILINQQNPDGAGEIISVTDNTFTMPDYPITVNVTFKKKTYGITLPTSPVGYTVKPTSVESEQNISVEHGASFTFYVNIEAGYATTNNYIVKANDTTLTATSSKDNVYTYTIEKITDDQEITVTGVEKTYQVTMSETTNGRYTVEVEDGSSTSAAVKGTIFSITPTPAEGYKLNTVTVVKTDDSSTEVEVKNNSFTMPDYPVTISVSFQKKTYEVALPKDTAEYTVSSTQTSPVEYGGSYTFTVTIQEGYVVSDDFKVQANSIDLDGTKTGDNVYTYKIENVTSEQTITVYGVKDGTAPVVKITLDENTEWQSFQKAIRFELFIKEEKSFTITANDNVSRIPTLRYYISSVDLFPDSDKVYSANEIETTIKEWSEYSEAISLAKDGNYVLYAKATDGAGNVSYANTTGIVVDTKTPVISSVQNNGVYYGDVSFTVSDDNLDVVKVDGSEIQPVGGSYKVAADNNSHTVVAMDKAGNSVTYTITVYKQYDITLPKNTVGYKVESTQTSPINHGSSYSFTVTINEGYVTPKGLEVRANDVVLTGQDTSDGSYTYTIEKVVEAQNITVTGVEETYTITKSVTDGGSYIVKANNSEVSTAVKDTVVTVEVAPVAGYELDKITVLQKDGSDTVVTVDDKNQFTMPGYPVTVNVSFKKLTYTVTLPTEKVSYTVTSEQASTVEHGSDYTFKLKINKGYVASADFMVQANGLTLTPQYNEGVYFYTIKSVTAKQEVIVSGVVDGEAPTITITLDENNLWQNFLNAISFGLFFKEEKSLTITATDNVSQTPSLMYHMANTDLFPENSKVYKADEIEATIKEWKKYSEAISLAGDGKYVLYAKATDEAGNVSYASTTGIVVDTKDPVITGIQDDNEYYGDISFTVSDDNLDVVKIDDSSVQPDGGTYKITADNASHTVEAVDYAGNSVTYTIVVYKKYDITLPTETVGYKVEGTQTSPVNHGSSYSFTVSILDGYKATEKYAVQVNNKTIEPIEYGIDAYYYTIDSVTEPLSISVIGVNKLHEIAISEAINGSYTVTAEDGSNVTTAVKDTNLTITPSPEEGYELDKIDVIQKDGSNTTVTVDDKNQFTMPDYPVTVSVTFKKLTYAITLPTKTVGYTVDSTQSSSVEYGSDYTFKVTVSEGYDVPTALSVKANGNVLVATSINGKEYTYTLEKVVAAQEITVGGVSDITGPAVTITLDENNTWKNFLIKIGFGLFFKVEKNLTITAADAGSGIGSVMYYVSESDLFPEDETYSAEDIESRIPEWTEYTEAVSISEDKSYVVYAKATDEAGNVSYASTSGIVIDTTAPVISGLENGGTYYGDTSATISDDNLSTVKLDGKEVEFTGTNASVTIFADSEEHTIEVADKAGNQTTYRVGVYETWVRDGISTAGSRSLKSGVPYKFGSGKWKVAGDTTVYEGGNTFYASEEGTFEFQNQ